MANPAAAVKADKPPRKVLRKSVRDTLTAYTFIAPNFIGFCVFTLVPMVFAIALAFCSWDGRHAIEFVGISNFIRLFQTDRIFQAALVNTIVYVVGTVPLTLVCSLAMAVLLNQNVRLRNFFRTVAFFPYVASLVPSSPRWSVTPSPSTTAASTCPCTSPSPWLVTSSASSRRPVRSVATRPNRGVLRKWQLSLPTPRPSRSARRPSTFAFPPARLASSST